MTDIKRLLDAATPGPWEPVPEEGRHGPYVTSDFGSTIADCYYMRQKHAFSTETVPSNYMAEMAPANAALIALAPELARRLIDAEARIAEIREILKWEHTDAFDLRNDIQAALTQPTDGEKL